MIIHNEITKILASERVRDIRGESATVIQRPRPKRSRGRWLDAVQRRHERLDVTAAWEARWGFSRSGRAKAPAAEAFDSSAPSDSRAT
jgi:hypothetical protein